MPYTIQYKGYRVTCDTVAELLALIVEPEKVPTVTILPLTSEPEGETIDHATTNEPNSL